MSVSMSKEELRAARLKALGGDDSASRPLSAQSSAPVRAEPAQPKDEPQTLAEKEFEALVRLVYCGGEASEEDILRWNLEGFQFGESPNFGLRQGHGGPCGVLAVVQANLVARLFFSEDLRSRFDALPAVDDETVRDALVEALLAVLRRCCDDGVLTVVTAADEDNSNAEIPLRYWSPGSLRANRFSSADELRAFLSAHLAVFQRPCGCLLLLLSAVLTRGVDKVRNDMDDMDGNLIGRFGHCNQELINLFLTGRATSNVFDGERSLGDEEGGMVMHGIAKQNVIGYLSYLEAMRYCEVGSYLKAPLLPIWVIGSSSHFTILFSLDKEVNDETPAERLLSTLRRAFKSIDKDECGFIPSAALKDVLLLINVHHDYDGNAALAIVDNETDLARLRGLLQSDGEIIIWNSFWENVSRLLSGESLEKLLDSTSLVCVDLTSSFPNMNAPAHSSRKRSDSEIAKQLQEELNANPDFDVSSLLEQDSFSTPSRKPRTMGSFSEPVLSLQPPPRFRSDSEIARELQAQWDAEEAAAMGPPGPLFDRGFDVDNMSTVALPDTDNIANSENVVPVVPAESTPIIEREYMLFHYNGLERTDGTTSLTSIFLKRRDANSSLIGRAATLGHANVTMSSNRPLEEVMWTKWSEASIRWSPLQPDPKID